MRTVGEILLEVRKKREITLAAVSEVTKIRPEFIRAIESNDFGRLPSLPTAYGFIKNYADFLGISSKFVLAVFRRDYCQNDEGKIIPRGLVKPLNKPKIFFSSRLGLFLAGALFIFGILFYLFFQYFSLIRGPKLKITSPIDQAEVSSSSVQTVGKTEPDATITINGDLITVDPEGNFNSTISLAKGKNLIIVEATNKLGKKRRVVREVYWQ